MQDFTAGVDGDAMVGPTDVPVRVFPKQAKAFDCRPKDVFTIKLDRAWTRPYVRAIL